MLNVDKLRGKMTEKRCSVEKMAVALHVNKTTLYRRMKGGDSCFTLKDVEIIRETLDLSRAEAESIFFEELVAHEATRGETCLR